MDFPTAPFDVVAASRLVWLREWGPEAASGMAAFTSVLRTHELLMGKINEVMRERDLTFARYEVLAWLAMDPESARALSWISRTLRIPPASVTNIIDRLEADELVRREPHPTDARTTLAVITPQGRRAADEATRQLNAEVYEPLGLSAAKRDRLVELLAELRADGGEFDVERSPETIEALAARRADDGRIDVA